MNYKKLFIIPILLAILTINLTPVYAIEKQNSTEETEILETTEEIIIILFYGIIFLSILSSTHWGLSDFRRSQIISKFNVG